MGIGGIIIVPVLVQVGGLSPQAAIPIALAGYIPTGALGILAHVRKGTLAVSSARRLCLGAVPAATLGVLAVDHVSASVLMLLMAAMAVLSGSYSFFRESGDGAAQRVELSSDRLLGLGSATGLLSSLTGTGGPAVLLPMLLYLEVPTVVALGLAQAVQLPIAGFATLVGLVRGQVDVAQSLMLGCGLAAGSWAGVQLAYRLDAMALRRMMALALILGGVAIASKQLARLF